MSSPHALASRFLLGVYALCLVLVCSFILFEVLDIDGSDFPAPVTRQMTSVKIAEPPHDVKRFYPKPLSVPQIAAVGVALGSVVEQVAPPRIAVPPRVRPEAAHSVVGLARSSLDVPPA